MAMLPRHLAPTLREAARHFPVVTLTGPRQSGKTTLVRATFPGHAYVSLELPDERAFAREDPRGFLDRYPGPVILDEVQRAPELLSYIQAAVDEAPDRRGRFILTGSHNFLLREKVSQSLAGRTAVLHLLPLSLTELWRHPPLDPERLAEPPQA
ncbi:MAG TPA: AAA family ATPase, partial [Chromatiales bacterium]|nr:AAA family ATPase [Chromatiales bacterium]